MKTSQRCLLFQQSNTVKKISTKDQNFGKLPDEETYGQGMMGGRPSIFKPRICIIKLLKNQQNPDSNPERNSGPEPDLQPDLTLDLTLNLTLNIQLTLNLKPTLTLNLSLTLYLASTLRLTLIRLGLPLETPVAQKIADQR